MVSSTAIIGMPASFAFLSTAGPIFCSGTTITIPFAFAAMAVSTATVVQFEIEVDVLRGELGAELLRLGLGSGDFLDKPGVVAILVDVKEVGRIRRKRRRYA